jgi:hypothetical protein
LLNIDQLSETLFHELTHAAHYNKVGKAWWTTFVNAELHEMIIGLSPYGDGNNSFSPIIALGESWAYHMGHFATDWKYGNNSGGAVEQGILYGNGPIWENGILVANTGLNTHLNLLEDFSPNRKNVDPFWWIPQGLYYDLIDNRNDNFQFPLRVQLDDQVSGYSNSKFFNALDTDITTLQDYRARLLSENSNDQATGVTAIFNYYGY